MFETLLETDRLIVRRNAGLIEFKAKSPHVSHKKMKHLIVIAIGIFAIVFSVTSLILRKNDALNSATALTDSLAGLHQIIDRQDSVIAELTTPARGFRKLKPGYAVYLTSDSSAYMFMDPDVGLIVVWLKYANPVNAPIPPEWFSDGRPRPKYTKGKTP